MRIFLSFLARAVRRGEIEVHAYCLMINHFHLLVRSPVGELSSAMKRVTNGFVRYFNRRYRRDGALFRGRFRSKRVDSITYRRTVVRYIDDNPVVAGMVLDAANYPWCSRTHYARPNGPIWLRRNWVMGEVIGATKNAQYNPTDYSHTFPASLDDDLREWIERRLRFNALDNADFDDLLRALPAKVEAQMARRLDRADGARTIAPVLTPAAVRAAIRAERKQLDRWQTIRGRKRRPALPLAEAGCLQELCALSQAELAAWLQIPRSTVQVRLRAHREQVSVDPDYVSGCAAIASRAFVRFRRSL